MSLLTLYYYTSIPLITCNLLFYSLTSLSNSITSSQTIFKFISEYKDSDGLLLQREINMLDIENKLALVKILILDIIKRYCNTNEEFQQIKDDIINPNINSEETDDTKEFTIIELKNKISVMQRIDEPVRYALLSTSIKVQKIDEIIKNSKTKIINHNNKFLKRIFTLCLKNEIINLHKQSVLLDSRLKVLFELLHIYLPVKKDI